MPFAIALELCYICATMAHNGATMAIQWRYNNVAMAPQCYYDNAAMAPNGAHCEVLYLNNCTNSNLQFPTTEKRPSQESGDYAMQNVFNAVRLPQGHNIFTMAQQWRQNKWRCDGIRMALEQRHNGATMTLP